MATRKFKITHMASICGSRRVSIGRCCSTAFPRLELEHLLPGSEQVRGLKDSAQLQSAGAKTCSPKTLSGDLDG